MTNRLTETAHNIGERLREHVSSTEGEPDEIVVAALSAAAAVTTVVLTRLTSGKRDTLALAMLATIVRHYIRGPRKPAVKLVKPCP